MDSLDKTNIDRKEKLTDERDIESKSNFFGKSLMILVFIILALMKLLSDKYTYDLTLAFVLLWAYIAGETTYTTYKKYKEFSTWKRIYHIFYSVFAILLMYSFIKDLVKI